MDRRRLLYNGSGIEKKRKERERERIVDGKQNFVLENTLERKKRENRFASLFFIFLDRSSKNQTARPVGFLLDLIFFPFTYRHFLSDFHFPSLLPFFCSIHVQWFFFSTKLKFYFLSFLLSFFHCKRWTWSYFCLCSTIEIEMTRKLQLQVWIWNSQLESQSKHNNNNSDCYFFSKFAFLSILFWNISQFLLYFKGKKRQKNLFHNYLFFP